MRPAEARASKCLDRNRWRISLLGQEGGIDAETQKAGESVRRPFQAEELQGLQRIEDMKKQLEKMKANGQEMQSGTLQKGP